MKQDKTRIPELFLFLYTQCVGTLCLLSLEFCTLDNFESSQQYNLSKINKKPPLCRHLSNMDGLLFM